MDGDALNEWSRDISRRWKRLHNGARNACKQDMGPLCPSRCSSMGAAGPRPGHVHPVFHLRSPGDLAVVRCYLAHVQRLAPTHGFGFVGLKEGVSLRVMSGGRAAAYLSSYFVTGKGRKATLQENVRNPHLPQMLIWVSPSLTGARDHDAESPSLPSTLGGTDGPSSRAVMVWRRARADRHARGAVARSGAVMGCGPGASPEG